LSLDYTATNISRIDEPYGLINTKEKKDSLLNRIATFGHNTSYAQTFNSSYNVPLAKLPLTDWVSLRLGYTANYSWTGAAPVAYELGNTLGNTQTETVAGELNMKQLYDKSKWLKAINTRAANTKINKEPGLQGGGPGKPGGDKQGGIKDLRKAAGKGGPPTEMPGGIAAGVDAPSAGKGADNGAPKTDTTKPPKAGTAPDKIDESLKEAFPNLDLSKMTDNQLDSLADVQKEMDKARARALKAKKKAARKAARKARHGKVPQLTPTEQAIGRVLTMVNRVSINVTQTAGTILPGYMDSTRFMGVNNYSSAPGFDFVYGYQPDNNWLVAQAAAHRLTTDSLFNAQLQQTYSRNITATASLVPLKDMRIDLNLTQTFSKSHSELYADTTYDPSRNTPFHHFNPYETGSFNITFVSLHSMFKNSEVGSGIYNQFLANRQIISRRLGVSNPYTNGLPDPLDSTYQKGYTQFSQDVLIPSFIAAYSGKDPHSAALIDYSHSTIRSNPFRYFNPLPNWKVTYDGLGKLPQLSPYISTLRLNHGYTATMSMNGFSSSLLFNDLYGLGFPSFIDPVSQNYIPFFQVPNVTISQAFNPLIGFDVALKNNLTGRLEVRKSKMESLSLIDYQVSENASTEYVIGAGFRKKGLRLPFKMFGVSKLKNELIGKLDIGIRDEKTSNTFLANNISVTSRGQKVIRISPTIDYSVTQKLMLHFFFDRTQTIPYVSNSYPTTTTRAGVTFRFIFAQ
jgi:cell surface protein SprA